MKKTRKIKCFIASIVSLITLFNIILPAYAVYETEQNIDNDIISQEESEFFYDDDGISLYANEIWYGDLCFDESTGTITSCNQSASGIITIPEKINGVTVQAIGESAFRKCTGITQINMSDTIISIGEQAFRYCSGITSMQLPLNLESIDGSAFVSCDSLREINISEQNSNFSSQNGVLFDKNKTKLIKYPQNKADTEYNVPSSVNAIGVWGFGYCNNLITVILPENISEIQTYGFYYCTNLNNVNLPANLTKIEQQTFQNCQSLKNIIIPNRVREIAASAFSGCTSLASVKLSDNLTDIGIMAFNGCKSLENITVPNGVTELQKNTFSNCTALKQVDLPDTITVISENVFDKCASLTEMTLPESLIEIGSYAFSLCEGLTEIAIPHNTKTIKDSAFSGCKNMSSAVFLSNTTQIGNYVFHNCNDIIIYGESGSTAQEYAQTNHITFIVNGANEKVLSPIASVKSGTVNKDTQIILTTDTDGAEIYYTIDGKEPTAYSLKYTEPIVITKDITIKAIAVKEGYINSDVSTYEYIALPYLYTITYDANGGSNAPSQQIKTENIALTLSSEVPKREGYIFLGWVETADAASVKYSPESEYTKNSDTVLYAVWRLSAVSDLVVTSEDCVGGKYITISSSIRGVSIYYTLDGTEPTTSSKSYNGKFMINQAGTTTIKAVGIKNSYENSNIVEYSVTVPKAPTPTISFDGENVIITTSLKDAEIKYSYYDGYIDNTYSKPISIENNSTKKIYAVVTKPGYATSEKEKLVIKHKEFEKTDVYNMEHIQKEYIFQTLRTDKAALDSYTAPYYSDSERDGKICSLAQEIIETARDTDATDYEKLIDLHNCVLSNIYYDSEYAQAIISGDYDGMKNGTIDPVKVWECGKTVCSGYTNLMMALARSIGIPCVRIEGRIWRDEVGHAWNAAFADGRWIVFDTTNDKFDEELSYWDIDYFCGYESLDALYGNKNINNGKLTIGENTEYIPEYAAYNNADIKTVSIPDSVKVIGKKAFCGCENLTEITIPDSVEFIGESAFAYCKNLKKVTLGKNLKTLSDNVFKGCESLESITLPDGMETIGQAVFMDCKNLKTAYVRSLLNISPRTFWGCENLNKILLNINLQSIGNYAFYGCDSLNKIELPHSLETIGDGIFDSLENLDIYFMGNAPESTSSSFKLEPSAKVYYYKNATGFDAEMWENVNKQKLNENMPEYIDEKCEVNVETSLTDTEFIYSIDLTSYNLYNPITALCAIYNSKGELVKTNSYTVLSKASMQASVSLTKQELEDNDMATIKCFVWNSINGMQPITEVYYDSI